jgi:hypothetical protein
MSSEYGIETRTRSVDDSRHELGVWGRGKSSEGWKFDGTVEAQGSGRAREVEISRYEFGGWSLRSGVRSERAEETHLMLSSSSELRCMYFLAKTLLISGKGGIVAGNTRCGGPDRGWKSSQRVRVLRACTEDVVRKRIPAALS